MNTFIADSIYSRLSVQAKADLEEIVSSYYDGGMDLAQRVFGGICEARKLTIPEGVMLKAAVERRLQEDKDQSRGGRAL